MKKFLLIVPLKGKTATTKTWTVKLQHPQLQLKKFNIKNTICIENLTHVIIKTDCPEYLLVMFYEFIIKQKYSKLTKRRKSQIDTNSKLDICLKF